MTRIFLLLLTCLGSFALAEPYGPMAHAQKRFQIPGDNRVFTRHVLIPVEREELGAIETRYLLAANAGEILDDARANGYTKGVSGEAYYREIQTYQSGTWPCAFITEEGGWQVLLHLAFASRSDDSPLPWEARFLGDNDGILPSRINARYGAGIGGFTFPYFQTLTELNERDNREILRLLAFMRPEVVGERTEFKFLVGREPSLLFLRELLRATKQHGLHRFSNIKYGEDEREDFQRLAAPAANGRVLGHLTRGIRSPHRKQIIEFLERFLLDPSLEPYVKNSGIYGHVSGEPKGESSLTARQVLLEKRLELPPPLYSFIESPSVGTAGIRTDIEATTMAYFEDFVLTSLERMPSLQSQPVTYLPGDGDPRNSHPCGKVFSVWEHGILNGR